MNRGIRMRDTRRPPLVRGVEVEVRSTPEILATLDARGEIDGLPFMPEMLRFAGQRLTVSARADTTCWNNDLRSMTDTVHLAETRCDGSSHGGCQAGCLLFWREEWLRLPDATEASTAPATVDRPGQTVTAEDLEQQAAPRHESDGDYYNCQATALHHASRPLKWWNPAHFVRDVRNENARAGQVLRYLAPHFFNKTQTWSKTHLPVNLQIRRGAWFPFVGGKLTVTPRKELHLEPGEKVRIKERSAISQTLSPSGHNRGLSFDVEMLEYCGQTTSVRARVQRNIDEASGRMLHMKSDCLVLDGVTCKAKYHGFCSRQTFPYWREIWLERAETGQAQ